MLCTAQDIWPDGADRNSLWFKWWGYSEQSHVHSVSAQFVLSRKSNLFVFLV